MLVPAGAFRTLDSERLVGLPDGNAQAVFIGLDAGVHDEIILVQIRDQVPDIGSDNQLIIEKRHLLLLVSHRRAPKAAFVILMDAGHGHPITLRKHFPAGNDAPLRLYEFLGKIAQHVRFVPFRRLQAFFLDIAGRDLHFPARHGKGDGTVLHQVGRRNGDNPVLAGHESLPGVEEGRHRSVAS